MRIAILGAGSIGCFVGGAWQVTGRPVRFIGRKTFAGDIAIHGLTLTDSNGWEAKLPPEKVDFSITPDALADADLIALATKSGATTDAAQQIRENARPGTAVLSLQNGISNIAALEGALGGAFPVIRGMVAYNVAYLGDGRFHKGVAGQVWAQRTPITEQLAEAVGQSPAGIALSNNMLGVAWGKLLINLNNAVNALSGKTLVEELGDRDYRRVFAASMQEGVNLLARAGITPAKVGPVSPSTLPKVIGSPNFIFNNLFMKMQKIDAHARSSMSDDFALGRLTEIDFLNGEILALARQLGTDAPVNHRIVELVRDAESGGRRNWPAAELRRAVLSN